ncbi:hypothetical protein [Staphylospora marina]|uniref:CdiA C-terminal domain-containing protein n=1 Tax=Staphylospora marina TaxID=2490858 RepID=UPI000F5BF834|nr:hypothetical protein [Staphylospora marina]
MTFPVYLDNEKTRLDWEAHQAADLKQRWKALEPFLTGCVDEKFKEIEDNYSAGKDTGAKGELEFLERAVFEEKRIVKVLEDGRNLPHPLEPEKKIKNPDYRVEGEICEIKTTNELGKNTIQNLLRKINEQIKGSGYESPVLLTEEIDGKKARIPTGIAYIQLLKGDKENLTINLEDLRNKVIRHCHPGQYRSVKEVHIYYENQLILQFARDEKWQMKEVDLTRVHHRSQAPTSERTQVDSGTLYKLVDMHTRLSRLTEHPGGLQPEAREAADRMNQAVQSVFQKEYPDLKLKPFTIETSGMALQILKENNAEARKLDPEQFHTLGFRNQALDRMISREKYVEMER